MAERKVLNKYYPPDFDPLKLPNRRRPNHSQIKVRMMLPMSIRCSTCGNYIYQGTKFNSRKEDVAGKTYLGIQIFRFYFKCTRCSAEITMTTDPQNSDYVVESGATRNYEPWRAGEEEEATERSRREAEEMGNAMKALENRTTDSRREMIIDATLDELKSLKSRQSNVSVEKMLEVMQREAQKREERIERLLDEEDEALVKSIVFHHSENFVRRIDDDADEDEGDLFDIPDPSKRKRVKISKFDEKGAQGGVDPQPKPILESPYMIITFRKPDQSTLAKTSKEIEEKQKEQAKGREMRTGLQALCQNYNSNDEENF